MSIVINQATWGDESSATDITESLQKQASGGYLNTKADNNLVPAIDLLGANMTVNLSDTERAEIKTQAATICGNVSDKKCLDYQQNQLETSMLQAKLSEKQSSANIVKGRRLTLTYTDTGTGVQRTVAVPDGQAVKFGTPPSIAFPTMQTLTGTALAGATWITTLIATVLYAFSIFVTYRLLVLSGHLAVAYVLTGLAIVVPYSGLVTTPIALAVFRYMGSQAPAAAIVNTLSLKK
jgi:hypothetical protein